MHRPVLHGRPEIRALPDVVVVAITDPALFSRSTVWPDSRVSPLSNASLRLTSRKVTPLSEAGGVWNPALMFGWFCPAVRVTAGLKSVVWLAVESVAVKPVPGAMTVSPLGVTNLTSYVPGLRLVKL